MVVHVQFDLCIDLQKIEMGCGKMLMFAGEGESGRSKGWLINDGEVVNDGTWDVNVRGHGWA